MNALIENVQIIRDAGGHPAFAVLPFAEYQALKCGKVKVEHYIPSTVVNLVMDNNWTPVRAWREHLGLTQTTVAARLNISQSAYAQQENSAKLRKPSREKIAKALGIEPEQLDF